MFIVGMIPGLGRGSWRLLLASPDLSPRPSGHLGAPQCTRCLITFADSKFQERHMKREHPADFVAQKLQGALFVCFTCARSFPSSKALIDLNILS